MPVEMSIWRMADDGPRRVYPSPLTLEKSLENMIVGDPAMVGKDLLIIGQQVPTGYGGLVDILALDAEGRVHVLELKRDRTPREVVAQVLDYGSWAKDLGLDDLRQISTGFLGEEVTLDEAFAKRFEGPLPDIVNSEHQLTIVASNLDAASDRIVEYLAETYGVPINAVFFRHFVDDERQYLARTWLLDPELAEAKTAKPTKSKLKPWNGRDFYVILGRVDDADNRWDMARKYGLLSAGGGLWYSKPLKNLTPGSRVFAYVGGAGYVGVGEVTGEMMPAVDAKVLANGEMMRLLDQADVGAKFRDRALSAKPEEWEIVVPVEWKAALPVSQAVSGQGLFTSQVTVCKLRDDHTIETLEKAFGLEGS